jgi:hypothetical protein
VSIEDSNLVDFVGTDSTTGSVVLTISDHLDWEREDQHLSLLQAKINTYLAFMESGELLEMYPSVQGKGIRIEIVVKYPLSHKALSFLRKAQPVVEGAGFSLSWRLLEAKTVPKSSHP